MKFYLVPKNYNDPYNVTIKGTFMADCFHDNLVQKKIDTLFLKINNSYYKGTTDNINFFLCPKGRSHYCDIWPHRIHFNVPWDIAKNLKEVILVNTKTKNKKSFLLDKIAAMSKQYDGLNVCVPVLYYYNNWLQMFLFLEKWREEKNARVIIYYRSLSLDVFNLLKYYEKIKLVTLLPAPNFPSGDDVSLRTPTSFFISHLFFDDCMYGRNIKYAAVIDVDEYFHIFQRNTTVLDFVKKYASLYPEKTFFNFESVYMSYTNHDINKSFKFGTTVTLLKDNINLKGKSITLIGKNEYIGYHYPMDRKNIVRSNHSNDFNFNDGYRFPIKKAILLHARSNYVFTKVKKPIKVVILKKSERLNLVKNYKLLQKNLGVKFPFKYKNDVIDNLQKCMKNVRRTVNKAHICGQNFDLCDKKLQNLDKWIYATNDTIRYYDLTQFN